MTRQFPPIVPERGVPLTAETVVVPVEPTDAMIEAGRSASHYQSYMGRVGPESLALAYRAMLSAAPAREPEGGAVMDALRELRGLFDAEGNLFCSGDHQLSVLARADAALTPKEAPAATGAGEDVNWRDEWAETAVLRLRLAKAARPFAELADEFIACGDGQGISIKRSSKAELTVGDLRALSSALRARPKAREEAQPVAASVRLAKAMWGVDLVPPTQPLAEGADAEKLRVAGSKALAFFKWARDFFWVDEGHEIDGGDFQDAAERLGLIVKVPFDPERHADNGFGLEFETEPDTLAALQQEGQ